MPVQGCMVWHDQCGGRGSGTARIGWWWRLRGCGGWQQGLRWVMVVGSAGVVPGGKREVAVQVGVHVWWWCGGGGKEGGGSGGVVVGGKEGGGGGVCVCMRVWWQVEPRGWGWQQMRWVVAWTAVEDGGGGASAGVVAGGGGGGARAHVVMGGGGGGDGRACACYGGDTVVGVLVVWQCRRQQQMGGGGSGGGHWVRWGVGGVCDVVCDHSNQLTVRGCDDCELVVSGSWVPATN
ncbi:hypothetical protein K439DRAFT_1612968 [Ramaria rubella]|nr:hypothetical protein K439DRAFT_1615574 [Ramaria rubella]KAF8589253.1 hypothetical protein K439DRAFT_1612968 [Ramaria rubella]